MNFLFYLDPSVEFNNPNFRFTSFRNSILPQARALIDAGHNVSVITNSVITKNIEKDGISLKGIDLIVIDIFQIIRIGNFSIATLNNNKEKLEEIIKIIKKKWENRPDPDIVIIWESIASYLTTIFKTAKFIYQTPGFFSRPPYPQLISLNSGLLSNSESPDFYSQESIANYNEIRNDLRDFFVSTSSIQNKVNKLKQNYSKIILFPLQVDGYFMVDSQIKGKNQLDILYDILENIPKDICLIVTDYRSKDINSNVINNNIKHLLLEKYKNLVYDEEINNTFCSSQQLLPSIDGVITISSSVGLQAAFWQLPLLVYGNNYVSYFATAENIIDFIESLGKKINQDSRIYRSLTYQNIPVPGKFISDKEWVNNLFKYINREQNILSEDNKWLENNLRKKEYLRAIKYDVTNRIDRQNCQELINQIKKHKIISFDIFDTLLLRPFLSPSDLFKFIEPKIRKILNDQSFDFVTKRRNAEKLAFEEALARNEGETSLNEIYEKFCNENKIDLNKIEELVSLEIDTERNILYRRDSIYNAYLFAVSLNKKIIITSDMYLPKYVIQEILKRNKIDYDNLYLSSEIKKKKSSGELFDFILSDLNCKPEDILHVGDNVKGDLKVPKSKGIHCFHMPRTIEKMVTDETGFYKNLWKRDERNHSLSARSILAILGNYYYDNAYLPLRKNTIFNGNIENLGFMGFGPLLFGYVKWLCEQGIRKGISDFYFLARDGKIMKEAYDIVSKCYRHSPKSHYMLCSRRSVNLCKIKDFSGINDLLHVEFASNIRLDALIKNRFGINPSEVQEEIFKKHNFSNDSRICNADVENLVPLFKDIQCLILNEADKERTAYLQYLNSIGFVSNNKKIGIVDIGYAGTMQQSLYQITNIKTSGFYLITFRKALERLQNEDLKSYGYLGNFIDRHDTCEPFCRFVPLFETLFSSADTSFTKFCEINRTLIPIYQDSCASEETRKVIVEKIHDGALNFIKKTCDSFKGDLKYLDVEPFKSERMLISYFSNPDARDAKLMQGIVFEDSYGGKSEKVILPTDLNFNGEVVWKNGLAALKKTSKQQIESNPQISNNSQIHYRFGQKVVLKLYKEILSQSRFQKLELRPEEFFKDSKNFITKNIVSKIYFMGK